MAAPDVFKITVDTHGSLEVVPMGDKLVFVMTPSWGPDARLIMSRDQFETLSDWYKLTEPGEHWLKRGGSWKRVE